MKPTTPRQKAGAAAAAISAAFLIVGPLLMRSEGKRNMPYRDPVNILTVCYGHTGNVERRRYSDAECMDILKRDFATHAEGVLQCVPHITERPYTFAASVDFAFNAGVRTFCRSSMAREFNRRNWTAGCKAFGLYKYAGGRILPGLVKRRKEETELCLRG
jgi:lysozyme